MSRSFSDAITLPSTVDYSAISDAQSTDKELATLLKDKNHSLTFEKVPIPHTNKEIYVDVSTGKKRPYIPKAFRRDIFDAYHNLAHPGQKTTTREITEKFIWPEMRKQINLLTKACLRCQKSKTYRHVVTPPGEFKLPQGRFSEVNMDIMGPLPLCNNFRYCLTLTDRFTKWTTAIPMTDMTAETCAKAFFDHWLINYGLCDTIITDQGRQFESQLFLSLTNLLGIKRVRTTSYNPKCNGLQERQHRTLKAALRCLNTPNWVDLLPSVLLFLRTCYREELGGSSAQMVYGESLKLPGDFFTTAPSTPFSTPDFVTKLQDAMADIKPAKTRRHGNFPNVFVPLELNTCSHVFIRVDRPKKPLEAPYNGPFPVLERAEKFFRIQIKNKEHWICLDRIKPAFILNPELDNENTNPSDSTQDIFVPNTTAGNRDTEKKKNDPTPQEKVSTSEATSPTTVLPSNNTSQKNRENMTAGDFVPPASKKQGEEEPTASTQPLKKIKKTVHFASADEEQPPLQPHTDTATNNEQTNTNSTSRTRYGRVSRPPLRYNPSILKPREGGGGG